jgi:5-methylcytosine-specific restriction endonuclease McrA
MIIKLLVDKAACAFCGKHPRLHSLELHHMDGDHSNNDLNNLVYLCTECHREFHVESRQKSIIAKEASYPLVKCRMVRSR